MLQQNIFNLFYFILFGGESFRSIPVSGTTYSVRVYVYVDVYGHVIFIFHYKIERRIIWCNCGEKIFFMNNKNESYFKLPVDCCCCHILFPFVEYLHFTEWQYCREIHLHIIIFFFCLVGQMKFDWQLRIEYWSKLYTHFYSVYGLDVTSATHANASFEKREITKCQSVNYSMKFMHLKMH